MSELPAGPNAGASAGRDLSVTAAAGGLAAGNIESLSLALPQPKLTGRPVLLPPRPAALAGREELLAELHDRLTGGMRPWPRLVALHGLGGAGKTSLAVEYAHRHEAETGVTWQLPAENGTVLEAGFSRLAALLGAAGGPLDARDPVASVHAVLASSTQPWLLVFDNAQDEASVRQFLPAAGPGRVLITSQSALWPHGQGLEVPHLGTDAAAAFLVNRTGDADHAAAADLAYALGGLPLALEQAAAYIEVTGDTINGYLGLFQERRADLLARGQVFGHPESVTATLAMALARLEVDAPDAVALLRLLACLAPEPIPLGLLLAPSASYPYTPDEDRDATVVLVRLARDPIATVDAIAALRRFSLVSPSGPGLVLVHRLVQAITLDQADSNTANEWRQVAAMLADRAVPGNCRIPASWPTCAVLLPHVLALLDGTSAGMQREANYLGHSGSYEAARGMWTDIVAAEEALGIERPDTLTARANLAHWTGEAGDPAAAREQYSALLPVRKRNSGADHSETLTIRACLARWTGEAGDPAAAREQYSALLPDYERVLGPDHRDTLTARASLARWTGRAGNWANALVQYAALLPDFERILGDEHPETLDHRRNCAQLTGEAGDPIKARRQFAELLPLLKLHFGAEHRDTLTARAELARWTGEAGDPAEARDQYAELLAVFRRRFGAEHRNTLAVLQQFAHWMHEAKFKRRMK